MTTQQSDSDEEYARKRAQLRECIRTTDSEAERQEAVRRLAEIDREIHADVYEELARECANVGVALLSLSERSTSVSMF